MDDPSLDENPTTAAPDSDGAHVPWESIDEVEEESEKEPAAEAVAREVEDEGDQTPDPLTEASEEPGSFVPAAPPPTRGGGWTLPLLCAGIALVACCALIPQSDANRRLAYERETLKRDLETVEKQIAVNASFLKNVGQDPTLAERLAQRQMKVIPQGARVLELPREPGSTSMSPFQLVNVAPPPALPPYKPVGGFLARMCYDPHSRLYLIGIALGMIATGLVMGSNER